MSYKEHKCTLEELYGEWTALVERIHKFHAQGQ